jgi:hypothetical protein
MACGLLPPPGSVIGSIQMEAFRARGCELGPVIAVDARERHAFRLPVFEPERIDHERATMIPGTMARQGPMTRANARAFFRFWRGGHGISLRFVDAPPD